MSAFLDHDLTPPQRTRMERHVSECHQCRTVLTGLQLLVAALNRLLAPADRDASRIAASVRARITEPT
jgi:anti-sigma factor RsiW